MVRFNSQVFSKCFSFFGLANAYDRPWKVWASELNYYFDGHQSKKHSQQIYLLTETKSVQFWKESEEKAMESIARS